jgi:hypothetical protein
LKLVRAKYIDNTVVDVITFGIALEHVAREGYCDTSNINICIPLFRSSMSHAKAIATFLASSVAVDKNSLEHVAREGYCDNKAKYNILPIICPLEHVAREGYCDSCNP